tara:strand:+ start:19 stop:687 length:669 start_codon:yes stop_codon:yes gene_type:complete
LIKLNDINQTYTQGKSTIEVFSNLNLDLNVKNNIGIIGPSGSGKSSLLNILGLIEKPKSGDYFFNGNDCINIKVEKRTNIRKKDIGFIFQNNQLLEDFTVLENIALPLILNGESYSRSINESLKLLKILGLEKRRKFKPGLLSGGEQQRVAIARAIIKKPLLLLADEPTGSLDDLTASLVFDFMLKLSKENGILTIIATHNLKLIQKLDKCFKIENGKLNEI